jgi:predicted RNase H-like HicB family nuclease
VTVAGREFTYRAKQDPEDGWWVAFVDDLPGCGSQARDLDELREMVADAVYGYLVVRGDIEDDAEAPHAGAV